MNKPKITTQSDVLKMKPKERAEFLKAALSRKADEIKRELSK